MSIASDVSCEVRSQPSEQCTSAAPPAPRAPRAPAHTASTTRDAPARTVERSAIHCAPPPSASARLPVRAAQKCAWSEWNAARTAWMFAIERYLSSHRA